MTLTLLFLDGFESGSPTAPTPKWTSEDFAGSETGRHGIGTAWNTGGTGNYPVKNIAGGATKHIGIALKKTTIAGGALVRVRDVGTVHIGIGMDAGGRLLWQRGTTTVETGADIVWQDNVWNFLEFRVTIANTGGRLTVKFNGTQIFDYTGDTQNGASATINEFAIQNASNTGALAVDDLYIYQCTDFVNDPWIGDARVFTIRPSGAGNYAQWTPSAGSNYQNVDEASSDSDTTYNSTSGSGNIDTFAMENLPATGTVKAVQSVLFARKDDIGTRTLAHTLRRNSVDSSDAGTNIADTYGIYYRIMETDPTDASAWDTTKVDALEAGYKLVA